MRQSIYCFCSCSLIQLSHTHIQTRLMPSKLRTTIDGPTIKLSPFYFKRHEMKTISITNSKKGVSYSGSFLDSVLLAKRVKNVALVWQNLRFAKTVQETSTNFPHEIYVMARLSTCKTSTEERRLTESEREREKERKKSGVLLLVCEMREPQPFDNVIIRWKKKKNSQWRYFCVP